MKSLRQSLLHPLKRRSPALKYAPLVIFAPLMDGKPLVIKQCCERWKEWSGRNEAVNRRIVQAWGEAIAEVNSAETA